MAGIGEAGAIINVAQIGISLSNTLIAYIGEVKDAPSRIHRIGNEVLTTSERLKDIGELVEKNNHNRILSEESIKSAVRCSSECHKIIEDVKTILCKSGWQGQPRALEEDEIDTSLFSTLRWPFLKVKLEVPRVELQRIKIDLSLIFTSAMVFTASSVAEQEKFKQSIPRLSRTKQWATRRSEEVKQRAMEAPRDPSLWAREGQSVDDESDIIEEFVSFQQQRYEEEENRKARARAALLGAEEEERTRLKEEAEREVKRRAVEQYKQEQERLRTLTAEKKDTLRSELSKVGLHDEQIQVVLDSPNLDFSGASESTNTSDVPPVLMSGPTPSGSITSEDFTSFGKDGNVSITPRGSRRTLSRWRSKKPGADNSSERSLKILSESSNVSSRVLEYETWLMDVSSSHRVELLPSNEWLDAKLNNPKKDHDVWHCFAGLKPAWRTAILDFIKVRSQNPTATWSLYYIEVPRRWSRTSFFGHKRDEDLVQLILCRRRDPSEENGNLMGKPRTGSMLSNPSKKVSFAIGQGGESTHHEGMAASNNTARPRIGQEVSERIDELEARRSKLGPDNQERISEIDDMIDLLRDQRRLEKSLSEARTNVTTHDIMEPKRITRSVYTPTPPIREDVTANNGLSYPSSYSSTRPPRSLPRPNPRFDLPRNYRPPTAPEYTNKYPMSYDDELFAVEDDSDIDVDIGPVPHVPPNSYFERDSEQASQTRPRSSRTSSARLPAKRPVYGYDERDISRWYIPRRDGHPTPERRPVIVERDLGDLDLPYDVTQEDFREKKATFTEEGSKREDDMKIRGMSVAARQREERQNSKSRGRLYSPSPSFRSHGTGKSAYGYRSTTSTTGQHSTLVPRAAGRRLLRDYLQDQILEKSIRVQGGLREYDDDVYRPTTMRERDRKRDTSRSGSRSVNSHWRSLSRRDNYRETDRKSPPRTDALDKRREAETSEEDDYSLDLIRVGSEKLDSETEPSDAEVIDRTLRRLTTFGGDTLPATGMSAPPLSNVDDEWASSAMPNGSAHLDIETDSASGNSLRPTSIVPGTPSNPRATRLLHREDATQRIASDESGEDIVEGLKANGVSRRSTVEDLDHD